MPVQMQGGVGFALLPIQTYGNRATTLISNWNPYSQLTPMPVSVG